MKKKIQKTVMLFVGLMLVFQGAAWAGHSWGGYHWARSSNPVSLGLGDNVTSQWDSYLQEAARDWDASRVLTVSVVPGGASSKQCRPGTGRIEVCNARYGNTGWLGIAQVWVSGSHITKANTKLNDTYFDTATYNTPAWRRLVVCQEVGHDFGLDHQDENFNNPNLGTCMDYTSDPDGPPSNEHPNTHDYDMLETIYAHSDSSAPFSPAPAAMGMIDFAGPEQWGKVIEKSADGRGILYELDFGGGHKVFTHVFWAPVSPEHRNWDSFLGN